MTPERQARYQWAAVLAAGQRVLDAGCGNGAGTTMLAGEAASAVGVDPSAPAIAAAQRAHGPQAKFCVAMLNSLPFGEGSFDRIVCFEALVQVADPEPALDELRRVLHPEGVLAISTPNPRVYPAGNPLQLSELGPAELESMLSRRFANVALHRQHAYTASLLCDAATLAAGAPPQEIEVRVAKAGGELPGSELHTVAMAGDGALPAPPAWLAIGEDIELERERERLGEWQRRAVRAEAEALSLRKQLRAHQR